MENEKPLDIAALIQKGHVFNNVEGATAEEIYLNISKMIDLPYGISSEQVYNGLCERERILSTAVGNGIALPHSRIPVIKDFDDQRVCVVYLKEPLDMHAPDERRVSVMFILLTANSQNHLKVLSALVGLFRKNNFKRLLDDHASEVELVNAIKDLY